MLFRSNCHIFFVYVVQHLEQWVTDVATQINSLAGCTQQSGNDGSGGRFTVGTGDTVGFARTEFVGEMLEMGGE